ncbi:spore protease YyaC [Paenibacillus tarimensis]|uniref:spore protease YyaC n=1 Tax=Paenibacillus tarimensis TaxID=416012 RepID=UPI001F29DCAF|nr:spore protease YyaC [Paenibacillus tarimensis]MCF2944530.1 spore protease YyaC [Paenibacillus tarimensis]
MKMTSRKETPFKIAHTESNVGVLLTDRLTGYLRNLYPEQRLVIVCVGTDRSTGDSLGPLIGSQLSKHRSPHYDLFGTLEQPVHAVNLEETLQHIERNIRHPFVIGIDACLGQVASVGCIQVGKGPVRPGAGVNKELPPVGDIHITGIVNVGGFMEYFVLQNTRLHLVIRMAEIIARSLHHAVLLANRPAAISAAQPE